MRKTIAVEHVIDFANNALATVLESEDTGGADRRWGIIGVVESVLIETGNYHGFRYLGSEYAKEGEPTERPGTPLRKGYDETRRAYYTD